MEARTTRRRLGRPPLYPWAYWLDGRVWLLERGVDFKVSPHAFRVACRCAAATRGLRLDAATRGDNVAIRAYKL
jgi:hypothetical protein